MFRVWIVRASCLYSTFTAFLSFNLKTMFFVKYSLGSGRTSFASVFADELLILFFQKYILSPNKEKRRSKEVNKIVETFPDLATVLSTQRNGLHNKVKELGSHLNECIHETGKKNVSKESIIHDSKPRVLSRMSSQTRSHVLLFPSVSSFINDMKILTMFSFQRILLSEETDDRHKTRIICVSFEATVLFSLSLTLFLFLTIKESKSVVYCFARFMLFFVHVPDPRT